MMHGTRAKYVHDRCRCEECTRVNSDYQRVWLAQHAGVEPPEHGTRSSYVNYRCRCDECTAAGAVANREAYVRRTQPNIERRMEEPRQ